MSKYKKNLPWFTNVYRMIPISELSTYKELFEETDSIIGWRIRYRGPRDMYKAETQKANATHFTAYIERKH